MGDWKEAKCIAFFCFRNFRMQDLIEGKDQLCEVKIVRNASKIF